jgi:uncharacterized protein (DUF433 family)/DNA-binding transcriptional MerR regulator
LPTSTTHEGPWKRRLRLPAYSVRDAARYAHVSVGTIRSWQRAQGEYVPALAARESGDALSYLQLVELRFVAAMRDAGVKLKTIRKAREYLAARWRTDYPFAMRPLKTDGQYIIQDLEEAEGKEFEGKLMIADKGGQISWKPIIGDRFLEFDYEGEWAMRWRLAGTDSPVIIDPRIAFGSPMVRGVPTWALLGRYDAGESSDEIAADFDLDPAEVKAALDFEHEARNKNKH